jgi:hypothetical protein
MHGGHDEDFNQYVDGGDVPSSSEEELDKYLLVIEVLLELLSFVHFVVKSAPQWGSADQVY